MSGGPDWTRNFAVRKPDTFCYWAGHGYGIPGKSYLMVKTNSSGLNTPLPAKPGEPDPVFGWPGKQGIPHNPFRNKTNVPSRLLPINEGFHAKTQHESCQQLVEKRDTVSILHRI